LGNTPEARLGRLQSIDLLRGAAALGVVAYHVTRGQFFVVSAGDSPWTLALTIPSSMGFSGVYLFFVISGFCIHLAWARQQARDGAAAIDFLAFWKRRIQRLYPPYLVALGLYLLVLWLEGAHSASPRLLGWDVGLHLFMIHNIDPGTVLSINGVFWTLAIEEQLYLAYFLLLALRRRLGWPWALGICLAARVGWFAFGFAAHRLWGIEMVVGEAAAAHWFVWALGAWSVEAWYGLVARPRWTHSTWTFVLSLLAAAGLTICLRVLPPGSALQDLAWFLSHPLWGLAFFALVNRLTLAELVNRRDEPRDDLPPRRDDLPPRVSPCLSALSRVGLFSYSLYLTHELVLTHLDGALASVLPQGAPSLLLVRFLVFAPMAVAAAWLFFVLFERPFLAPRRHNVPGVEATGLAGPSG